MWNDRKMFSLQELCVFKLQPTAALNVCEDLLEIIENAWLKRWRNDLEFVNKQILDLSIDERFYREGLNNTNMFLSYSFGGHHQHKCSDLAYYEHFHDSMRTLLFTGYRRVRGYSEIWRTAGGVLREMAEQTRLKSKDIGNPNSYVNGYDKQLLFARKLLSMYKFDHMNKKYLRRNKKIRHNIATYW